VPSPRARPPGIGLVGASGSGSGAARDEEIEEEVKEEGGGDDDEGEEEIFDVEEINPPNYVAWDLLCSRCPQTLHGG
jgi:hypothetical protein